jgi:hypothetical protein
MLAKRLKHWKIGYAPFALRRMRMVRETIGTRRREKFVGKKEVSCYGVGRCKSSTEPVDKPVGEFAASSPSDVSQRLFLFLLKI